MKFISHPASDEGGNSFPEILLKDHLMEVGKQAAAYIDEIPISNNLLIKKCAFIAGISHDFGKYTTFFQEHVNGKTPKTTHSQHSFISSLFGAFLGFKLLDPSEFYGPLYIYLAIKHHHGNLTSLEHDFPRGKFETIDDIDDSVIYNNFQIMQEQIENMRNNKDLIVPELEDIISNGVPYGITTKLDVSEFFKQGWIDTTKNIITRSWKLHRERGESNDLTYYFQFMLIFSSLIDGDKRSAGRVPKLERSSGISRTMVAEHVGEIGSKSQGNRLLEVRKNLFKKVEQDISSIELTNHIFTITAPTGSGKTLAALNAAISIRDRASKSKCEKLRIVYALPFTSIIDQTYSIFDKILSADQSDKLYRQRILIKHHHLADIDTHIGDENYPLDLALALTESWDSEIIVTTFVQVFESIIGNKNRSIRKVHRMANSVIILDEIQSLRVELWKVLGEIIRQMAEKLNVYFILMTATQPLIVESEHRREIGFGKPLENLDRTIIKFSREPINADQVVDQIVNNSNEGKSVLVIRNTIKTSIATYKSLLTKSSNLQSQPKIYYLSTNITPKDRIERVCQINESLDNKEKVIVVSTQVMEAGIDFDFDSVIRDVAPIDSIIQAAGRCNRNGTQIEPGIVTIVNEGENSDSGNDYPKFSRLVYGKLAMDISVNVLKRFGEIIRERDFPKLMETYFDEVCKRNLCKEHLKHNLLIDSMVNLDFDSRNDQKSVSEPVGFSLLEDNRPMVDVFIVRNDDDQKVLDWYKEKVLSEKDPRNRKMNMLEIRSKFRQRIISVDKTFADSLGARALKEEDSLYILDRGLTESYYDNETGLRRTEEAFLTL